LSGEQFEIDPASLAAYRRALRAMVKGMPVEEAAIDRLTDWQVVQAMESLWAAATEEGEGPEPARPAVRRVRRRWTSGGRRPMASRGKRRGRRGW
jgi:hypothetical protein